MTINKTSVRIIIFKGVNREVYDTNSVRKKEEDFEVKLLINLES